MTKREAIRELRMARDDLREVEGELEQIRRLHEVATERNVAFAAAIDAALAAVHEADVAQASGLDTRIMVRDQLMPVPAYEKALRGVKHRLLLSIADELDAKGVPGLSVGAPWLRKRGIGILVGVDR